METKYQVLQFLELHQGEDVSGELLSQALCLSRNAVWKAVEALRAEGLTIHAATKRGYCLPCDCCVATEQGLRSFLSDAEPLMPTVRVSVDSTNALLRTAAENDALEGDCLIALRQTAGRGRRGRNFYSPCGSGAYISLLLRPKLAITDALGVTTAAAAATAEAIQTVCGKEVDIKWVNDLYLDGKKVCGILTEAAADCETGGLRYAILGIGLNIRTPSEGFPKELDGIAGALYAKDALLPPRLTNRLTAEILKNCLTLYQKLPQRGYMDEYRRRSLCIGRMVELITPLMTERVKVLDVTDDAALCVCDETGKKKLVRSGELGIRPADGRGWIRSC